MADLDRHVQYDFIIYIYIHIKHLLKVNLQPNSSGEIQYLNELIYLRLLISSPAFLKSFFPPSNQICGVFGSHLSITFFFFLLSI